MASLYRRITSALLGHQNQEIINEHQQNTMHADKLAKNPNKAWLERLQVQEFNTVEILDIETPIFEDKIRFVCISDTHTKVEQTGHYTIPAGDVLLHTGDFTVYGKPDEVHMFNEFLGTLPHPYKVVIAGNHDMSFDLEFLQGYMPSVYWSLYNRDFKEKLETYGVKTVHEMMTNCIYLQDSSVSIYGINIYGAPWSPGSSGWGFQTKRGQPLLNKWNQIPEETDILMTHSPPCGHGDDTDHWKLRPLYKLITKDGDHVGCVDLLNTVQQRVKPKYHVFGHIHQGYGVTTDGTTMFVNASTCTEDYYPDNQPIIFDIPLPEGQTKQQAVSKDTFKALSWAPETKCPERENDERKHQEDS